MWLFWAYVRMMPVLHARESIHEMNEMIYAQGNMRPEAGSKFIGELERIAARAHERGESIIERPIRPKDMGELSRLLASSSSTMAGG